MTVDLELYRVFYQCAVSGSMSRAAEQLFMSQPAVSQAIARLEDQLEVQLFFRTPRGVQLTPEGRMLMPYIDRAYNLIVNGEKKLNSLKNLETGEIRVGASDTLCKHYLLPHLETFHSRYPSVRIHVTNGMTGETIDLLKQGKVDLGVVSSPVEDDELDTMRGMPIHDTFVVGKRFVELASRPVALRELIRYPVLLLERGSNMRAFIEDWARKHGFVVTPEIELGSLDLLVEFATIGLGVAHVVREFVADKLEQGEVFEVQLKEKVPARHTVIATLHNAPLSSAASAFVELLDLALVGDSG